MILRSLFIILLMISNSLFIEYDEKINQDEIIIDCQYTFEEALEGIKVPESIKNKLTIVDVEYFSFDNKLHRGQIVIHKSAARDIKEVFEFIKNTKFPIAKAIPITKYHWSDEASMKDNNTSAFNYRKVAGQEVMSVHANGLAIDINPRQNPHYKKNEIIPSNGNYDETTPGTITKNSQLVSEFKKRGWQWGGAWRSSKDYQHFEKK
jgi:hypothetical protein